MFSIEIWSEKFENPSNQHLFYLIVLMYIWLDKVDLIRVCGICCPGERILGPLVLKYKRTSRVGYPSY